MDKILEVRAKILVRHEEEYGLAVADLTSASDEKIDQVLTAGCIDRNYSEYMVQVRAEQRRRENLR